MEDKNRVDYLEGYQKFILILVTFLLFIALLFFRVGFNSRAPLDQLVKNSIEFNQASTNNKPTVLEFYADWCESCKAMAPNMLMAEKKYSDKLNIVMLNVDNTSSQDFIEKYKVNGIPQINFFDKDTNEKGKEIGYRSFEEIDKLFEGLINNKELSELSMNLGLNNLESQSSISSFPKEDLKIIKPRSHS